MIQQKTYHTKKEKEMLPTEQLSLRAEISDWINLDGSHDFILCDRGMSLS